MSDSNIVSFPAGKRSTDTSATTPPDVSDAVRMVEAVLFASSEPVPETALAAALPDGVSLADVIRDLEKHYRNRGVTLHKVGDAYAFRTADDLSFLLQKEAVVTRRLSKAALEVMAIIAYHQPVTRAEIEDIRGVATSKGTLDVLMETGWVRMRGRRKTPGRPVTYGTTAEFLDHFGLESLRDLPGLGELKGAGLLQSQLPAAFDMPAPADDSGLDDDEEPLDSGDIEDFGLFPPGGSGAGDGEGER